MKRFTHVFIFLIALFTLLACKKEHVGYDPQTESGSLQLNKIGINVILSQTTPSSRAAIDTKDFIVTVYDNKTGAVAQDVNKEDAIYTYRNMPEIITLYTGEYYIVASSLQEMPAAAWETPYYEGRSEVFTIKKSTLTPLSDINCTQKNVRITVSYTERLKQELASFYAVIALSNNENAHLEFDKEAKLAGYFKPGKLIAILNGERNDEEKEEVSVQVNLDSITPGQHQNIEFDVTFSSMKLTIHVNTDLDIIDKDIIVPPDEDEPIEDPDTIPVDPTPVPPSESITIIGRGFNIDKNIEFAVGETKDVVVDIAAAKQIYNLWVEIDSPFLTEEELGGLGIPKKFNLGDLTPALKTAFGPEGLGLIDGDVRGKDALVFDISQFTALLLQAGTHKFIITVEDYENNFQTKTLTLVNH